VCLKPSTRHWLSGDDDDQDLALSILTTFAELLRRGGRLSAGASRSVVSGDGVHRRGGSSFCAGDDNHTHTPQGRRCPIGRTALDTCRCLAGGLKVQVGGGVFQIWCRFGSTRHAPWRPSELENWTGAPLSLVRWLRR